MDEVETTDLSAMISKMHGQGCTDANLLMWKKVLCMVIEKMTDGKFNSLPSGSVSSSEASKKEAEAEVFIEFIKYCIRTAPQLFVPAVVQKGPTETSELKSLSSKSATAGIVSCHDFTCWVIYRLLYLLMCLESESVLAEKTYDVVVYLLKAISYKDVCSFKKLAETVILAIAELCSVSDDVSESSPQELKHLAFQSSLHHRGKDDDVILSHKPLMITNTEMCDELIVHLSKLVTEVISNICVCASDMIDHPSKPGTLWSSVVWQLENGEMKMKMVALKLASVLLINNGICSSQSIDYFLECVLCLHGLIASGIDSNGDDCVALEKSLVDTVEQVWSTVQSPDVPDTIAHLVYNYLAKGFMGNVISHGNSNIRSPELRNCVCDILCRVYDTPSWSVKGQISEEERAELNRVITEEIGLSRDCQYTIKWLRVSILEDMKTCAVLNSSASPSASLDLDINVTSSPQSKKKKLSLQSQACKKNPASDAKVTGALDKSPTAVLLSTRLHRLIEWLKDAPKDEGMDYVCVFEGLKTLLQVFTWSAVTFVDCGSDSCIKDSALYSTAVVDEILNICSDYILKCTNDYGIDTLSETYSNLVECIGCILFGKDVLSLTVDMLQTITWILSMYWLPTEMSWMDLKCPKPKNLTKICSRLSDKMNPPLFAKCVYWLGLIPKEVAFKWRSHVLKLAMFDTNESVCCEAVNSFPVFLHYSGPNFNHLVYDHLHSLMKDKRENVQIALASNLGCLCCVVSRKAYLNRNLKNSGDICLLKSLEIGCSSCENTKAFAKDPTKNVDPAMLLPFTELVQSSYVSVRLAVVNCIERLFSHVVVRSAANTPVTKLLSGCLNFLKDPDVQVRQTFSRVIHFMLSESVALELGTTESLIIDNMKKVVEIGRSTNNLSLLESLLQTAGQLALQAEGSFLVMMLIVLLDTICMRLCPLVSAIANNQLRAVALAKEIKLNQLFMQFSKKLCQLMVQHMYESEQKKLDVEPLGIVKEVVDAFEFESVQQFLKKMEPHMLPFLVRKGTPIGSKLIKIISKQVGDPSHKGPICRNIRHIYCSIVCSTGPEDFVQKCMYLQDLCEWDLADLLVAGPNLEFDLLLHLASHREQVMRGFKCYLSKINKDIGEELSTDEGIAQVLQPKLLGILVHFDNYLNNGTIEIQEKKKAYESIITLMELMGPSRITAVRVRIMTTLKIGLKFKGHGFPELCCKAWNCFVRSIDVNSLGPMLSQIVVNLLPLFKIMAKPVANIFTYLIVENRQNLHPHFHELYFVPDATELKDVIEVLKHYTEGSYTVKDVKAQISSLLKGISHESDEVRHHALSKLKTLLLSQKEILHAWILSTENVDPLISKIVLTLLEGCRNSAGDLRNLYGECLGELGAVDPGKLQLYSHRTKEDLNSFIPTVCEDAFGCDLICKLSQAYLRAVNRSAQDFVAFAVQELIQIYEITDDPEQNSPGSRIWKKFAEEVQEIISPLLNSRYMITTKYDYSSLHKPIYRGGRKGMVYNSWVCTLSGYLGSLVEQEKTQHVFSACRGVVRSDSQVALHVLPYAILHVLLEGNVDYITEITNEILAVLKHAKDPDTRHGSASDLAHMSAQTVFSVLDFLIKWTRHRVMTLSQLSSAHSSRGKSSHGSADFSYKTDPSYLRIKDFLDKVPQDALAFASYNCGAHTRSLMHYEQFVKSKKENLHMQQHLDFVQKLYVALDEPDGVAGISAIRQTQPTLKDQILAYESIGQLSDAAVCYDRAVRLDPTDLTLRQGLLRCRLSLGELNSAMEQTVGIIAEKPGWTEQLNVFRVEAAWKLGQWDKLEHFLKPEMHSRSWNVCLGKIFLAAKMNNEVDYKKGINLLRSELMGPLCAASMEIGSYQRGYDYIVQLHMLNELEQGMKVVMELNDTSLQPVESTKTQQMKMLLQQWDQRLQFTQPLFRIQERILNLRRTVLGLASFENNKDFVDHEVGNCWLQTAKIARECGLVQAAHSSLLCASNYNMPEFCLENAKWLWDRGDYDKAQVCLEKAIEEHYPDISSLTEGDVHSEKRFACVKVLLLLAQYREETSSLDSQSMIRHFRDIHKVYDKWEDSYFMCANYYDKLMNNMCMEKPEKKGEFILHVVMNLGQSLQYGCQYIYQSMPRMLSLWLDYGAELAAAEKHRNDTHIHAMKNVLNLLNKKIEEFTRKLPAYQFLTAFPQLISRICHADTTIFKQLQEIIATLLVAYPQQAMWGVMAVSKSSYQMRSKRCQEIFSKVKNLRPELSKFLLDAHKLTERLLDLCNRSPDNTVSVLSITQHFKPLQRLVNDSSFSSIMLPLQMHMTVTLPSSAASLVKHEAFPQEPVYIRGLEDHVELLPSLQRPKKVTFIGSDGKAYIMLCKPKDDLRKDARLMEFNSVVNKCLCKDPEARRRGLNIRTFTVTPLNEECGMLEWVQNTSGLRHILMKLYKEKGLYTSGRDLKAMQLPSNAPLQKKLDMFRNKLLPRHPTLFREWFLKNFPDPTSWYNARLSYCRTAAVMSMVGYILGLGDRHGENILLDSTTGDCVHVDFNCLFNKGETFDYPEIVPFRLTHNMVDAMGPLGVEGIFRRACEVCMRVMRHQDDSLMSVLKSFIYDPLVEWSKPSKGRSNPTETGEIKNEKGQTHVSNIEARLKGVLKTKSKVRGLPLSVEGHVNYLIKEATDENNLCQMYIGWAPYL